MNPAIKIISKSRSGYYDSSSVATVSGTIRKSFALIAVAAISAMLASMFIPFGGTYMLALTGSTIGALVIAIVTCFKPSIAEFTAPGYAVFEGVGLGLISTMYERMYYGITMTAVAATFVVALLMLFLWRAQIIVVTNRLRSIIVGLTLGVMMLYIVDMIAAFFSYQLLPHAGMMGIIISVIIVGIAAFNLVLDFDNIEQSVYAGMPKYMEYFNAFALLITLVWLYVEILRLLAMLRDR